MLKDSVENAQALEQNLQQQVQELARAMPKMLVLTRNLQYDSAQDDCMFSQMNQSVDDQYRNMKNVFQNVGLDRATTSDIADACIWRSESVYLKAGDTDMLKFRSRMLKPFGVCTLEKAFWRYVQTPAPQLDPGTAKLVRLYAKLLSDAFPSVKYFEVTVYILCCLIGTFSIFQVCFQKLPLDGRLESLFKNMKAL
ncbi:unnamed protein product [Phytophthora lilii]|uniref:Unnamed protein product n=1 Tax=Phytophthora lilii TaxID=2077276 RepID=A0A9W7CN26_9STRA|nr:unnamed protein product [Phytophthora lilii]